MPIPLHLPHEILILLPIIARSFMIGQLTPHPTRLPINHPPFRRIFWRKKCGTSLLLPSLFGDNHMNQKEKYRLSSLIKTSQGISHVLMQPWLLVKDYKCKTYGAVMKNVSLDPAQPRQGSSLNHCLHVHVKEKTGRKILFV